MVVDMNQAADLAPQKDIGKGREWSLAPTGAHPAELPPDSPALSSTLSTPCSCDGSPYPHSEASQGYFDIPLAPTPAARTHTRQQSSDYAYSAFAALADSAQFSPRIDPLEQVAQLLPIPESPQSTSRPSFHRQPSASLSQVMSSSPRLSSVQNAEASSSHHDRHLTMSSLSSERSSQRSSRPSIPDIASSKSSATFGSSRGSRTSYAPSVASSSSSRSWRSSSSNEEEEANYVNMLRRRERVLNEMDPEERRRMERDAQRGDQLAAYRLGLAPAKALNRGWHNLGSIASVWGPAMSVEPSVIRRATDLDCVPPVQAESPPSRSIFQPLDSSSADNRQAGDLFHAMATMTLNDNARNNNRTKNPLTAARVPMSSPALSRDLPIQFRPELAPRRNPQDKSIHFNGNDYFALRPTQSANRRGSHQYPYSP